MKRGISIFLMLLILVNGLFCFGDEKIRIECPKCGTFNSQDANFCWKCGAKLPEKSAIISHPGIQKIEADIRTKPIDLWDSDDFELFKKKYPKYTYKRLDALPFKKMTPEQQEFYLKTRRDEKYGTASSIETPKTRSTKIKTGASKISATTLAGGSLVGVFIIVIVLLILFGK